MGVLCSTVFISKVSRILHFSVIPFDTVVMEKSVFNISIPTDIFIDVIYKVGTLLDNFEDALWPHNTKFCCH